MPTHIHEMSPEQLLATALRLRMLLSEDNWIKQDYCWRNEATGSACFCLLGAVIEALYPGIDFDSGASQYEHDAGQFVANACEQFDVIEPSVTIIDWNDKPGRTWEEVDAVVDRIVQHYATMAPAAPYVRNEEGFL